MRKIGIETMEITKTARAIYAHNSKGEKELVMIVKLHKDYHEMYSPDLKYIGRSY